MIRCKFKCVKTAQVVAQIWSNGQTDTKLVHEAQFLPVIGGSQENKDFFSATPTGAITVSSINNPFLPGSSYYVDFTYAEEE